MAVDRDGIDIVRLHTVVLRYIVVGMRLVDPDALLEIRDGRVTLTASTGAVLVDEPAERVRFGPPQVWHGIGAVLRSPRHRYDLSLGEGRDPSIRSVNLWRELARITRDQAARTPSRRGALLNQMRSAPHLARAREHTDRLREELDRIHRER